METIALVVEVVFTDGEGGLLEEVVGLEDFDEGFVEVEEDFEERSADGLELGTESTVDGATEEEEEEDEEAELMVGLEVLVDDVLREVFVFVVVAGESGRAEDIVVEEGAEEVEDVEEAGVVEGTEDLKVVAGGFSVGFGIESELDFIARAGLLLIVGELSVALVTLMEEVLELSCGEEVRVGEFVVVIRGEEEGEDCEEERDLPRLDK